LCVCFILIYVSLSRSLIEDTEDSDNGDTNENTIKSQVDQAKQTKTSTQRNVNKDKTNAQWYEATKLLKTRWVSENANI
jgi:hypothetical protein